MNRYRIIFFFFLNKQNITFSKERFISEERLYDCVHVSHITPKMISMKAYIYLIYTFLYIRTVENNEKKKNKKNWVISHRMFSVKEK